jgi:hypothetical protein
MVLVLRRAAASAISLSANEDLDFKVQASLEKNRPTNWRLWGERDVVWIQAFINKLYASDSVELQTQMTDMDRCESSGESMLAPALVVLRNSITLLPFVHGWMTLNCLRS